MADTTDLFARRNRMRIVLVVLLATLNYMIAVALAAVAVTLGFILLAIFNFDIFPGSADEAKVIGIVIGVILVL
jgi:ABC-type Na+ efflux pump permease subunit